MICLSLLVLAAAAAPASAPAASAPAAQDRYSLVHGCFALKSKALGTFVGRTPQGAYLASAPNTGQPEGFRMQATALGRYLFYDRERNFMAGAPNDAVATQARADESADWRVDPAPGGGFTIALPSLNRVLAVTGNEGKVVLAPPGSGDGSVFTFETADGCPVFPEVEVSAFGTPSRGATSYGETKGFVDAHMHMMAFEFLGGSAHCGRPWHPYGVEYALVDCPDHEGGVSPLESGISTGVGPTHDPVGWPTFKDWPAYGSLTHEQSYYKWLERAWMGGLRTYVNLFVENAALCDLYPLKRNGCNEMESVRLQSRRIRELEDYIDAQSGGPGKGWFRIVTDPFQARRVINQGKLAVVLGIEISELFNCGIKNDIPQCDKAQIDRQLEEVYDMGVRDMELVNKFDNAFGGVAGDEGKTGVQVNTANKKQTGNYWDFQTCSDDSHDREQTTAASHNTDALIGSGLQAFLPIDSQAPVYPEPPHCNTRGLSPLGEHLVRKMMAKGMIIDPDHLSVRARRQLLSVAEAERYSGVVSSHSWSTPDAFPRIYKLGGVITPYAGSSTGFVKAWKETKPQRSKRFYFGFGYGADMNGFGAQGPPRNPTSDPVTYPFKSFDGKVQLNRQKSGSREFDINSDGVAHYGLYPDWIEDLRKLAGNEIVTDMSRGSEAYLQMWERAEGVRSPEKCHPARWRFHRRGLGRVRLGQGSVRALRNAGQPLRRIKRTYRYCVRGSANKKSRITSVFTRAGKTGLVVSNSRSHKARKAGIGFRAKRLRKVTKAFGKGLRVSKAGGTRYVYGVRRGRVSFVGVASRAVAKSPRRLRAHVRLAGLR